MEETPEVEKSVLYQPKCIGANIVTRIDIQIFQADAWGLVHFWQKNKGDQKGGWSANKIRCRIEQVLFVYEVN